MTTTVILVLGALLLILGRKLFWLFVAAAGFVLGFTYAPVFLGVESENSALIIGALFGLAGGVLAIFAQKIAISVAGFAATGFLAMNYAEAIFHVAGNMLWLVFVLAGILGALLVHLLFDWALIIISSCIGATLIAQGIHLQHSYALIVLLAALGIVIQARMRGKRATREE